MYNRTIDVQQDNPDRTTTLTLVDLGGSEEQDSSLDSESKKRSQEGNAMKTRFVEFDLSTLEVPPFTLLLSHLLFILQISVC